MTIQLTNNSALYDNLHTAQQWREANRKINELQYDHADYITFHAKNTHLQIHLDDSTAIPLKVDSVFSKRIYLTYIK